MSRMSREFSLVLLGAGVLTAGYFVAPSPDEGLEKKADQQAAERVAGHNNAGTHHRPGMFMPLLFVHSLGYAGNTAGRPAAAMSGVSRGGFGGLGRSAAVGG
jgi:hypothetical protein